MTSRTITIHDALGPFASTYVVGADRVLRFASTGRVPSPALLADVLPLFPEACPLASSLAGVVQDPGRLMEDIAALEVAA